MGRGVSREMGDGQGGGRRRTNRTTTLLETRKKASLIRVVRIVNYPVSASNNAMRTWGRVYKRRRPRYQSLIRMKMLHNTKSQPHHELEQANGTLTISCGEAFYA